MVEPSWDDVETVARVLLRRFGVVVRQALARESALPPWRSVRPRAPPPRGAGRAARRPLRRGPRRRAVRAARGGGSVAGAAPPGGRRGAGHRRRRRPPQPGGRCSARAPGCRRSPGGRPGWCSGTASPWPCSTAARSATWAPCPRRTAARGVRGALRGVGVATGFAPSAFMSPPTTGGYADTVERVIGPPQAARGRDRPWIHTPEREGGGTMARVTQGALRSRAGSRVRRRPGGEPVHDPAQARARGFRRRPRDPRARLDLTGSRSVPAPETRPVPRGGHRGLRRGPRRLRGLSRRPAHRHPAADGLGPGAAPGPGPRQPPRRAHPPGTPRWRCSRSRTGCGCGQGCAYVIRPTTTWPSSAEPSSSWSPASPGLN